MTQTPGTRTFKRSPTGRSATRTPPAVAVLAGLGVLLLVLPLAGLLQRAPWSNMGSLLSDPAVTEALRLSVIVSCTATVFCVLLGLPLAWLLARGTFRGKGLVRALVMLPMVLPPVVGGTALLFALGRRGLVGQWLDSWFGITLPFSTAGAVLAATFVGLPFFVITVEAAFAQLDQGFEETAASLGTGPVATLFRVVLPMTFPAIVAGTALSWARALGEFGATITFAGDSPGRTRTLPLSIFVALETNPERAIALSLVLVAISLAVLLALRNHWLGFTK